MTKKKRKQLVYSKVNLIQSEVNLIQSEVFFVTKLNEKKYPLK